MASSYPHNSPYAFSENRVIDGIELEGLEWYSIKLIGDRKYKIVTDKTIKEAVQTAAKFKVKYYDTNENLVHTAFKITNYGYGNKKLGDKLENNLNYVRKHYGDDRRYVSTGGIPIETEETSVVSTESKPENFKTFLSLDIKIEFMLNSDEYMYPASANQWLQWFVTSVNSQPLAERVLIRPNIGLDFLSFNSTRDKHLLDISNHSVLVKQRGVKVKKALMKLKIKVPVIIGQGKVGFGATNRTVTGDLQTKG